jgi:hemolysin III
MEEPTEEWYASYASDAQTHAEEIINTITHLMGLILSIPATILLVCLARLHGNKYHITGVTIYGLTMILMFTCSTLYHGSGIYVQYKNFQMFFRDLDHCAIYFLIAGTYTPLTLINLIHNNLHPHFGPARPKSSLENVDKSVVKIGYGVLIVVWTICIVGVSNKLVNGPEGVHPIMDYGSYLVMGWLIVFVARPMLNALPRIGVRLLVAGGLSYTVGVIFLLSDTIPFNHPVWHLFVAAGAMLHYFSVIACSIPISSSPWSAMEKRTRSVILEWSTRFASTNLVG